MIDNDIKIHFPERDWLLAQILKEIREMRKELNEPLFHITGISEEAMNKAILEGMEIESEN